MKAIDVWSQITTKQVLKAPWLAPLLRVPNQATGPLVLPAEATPRSLDAEGIDVGSLLAWRSGETVPSGALRRSVSPVSIGTLLMLGSGLIGAAPAMAGECAETPPGSDVFVCSGPADTATDVSQVLIGAQPSVSTQEGFGITTAVGDALQITGSDGVSFDDAETSDITGQLNGLDVSNMGTGSVSVTSTGSATGITGIGISAFNDVGGTDLTVTAVDTSGGISGIEALSEGSGTLTVTSTGIATGGDFVAIRARAGFLSGNGTGVSVTAADAIGENQGINVLNDGSGALALTSTGTVVGETSVGIFAFNSIGTDLIVEVADVSGGTTGIFASNDGSGVSSIAATGTVSGTNTDGIFVENSAGSAEMTVTVADVNGGNRGMIAIHRGSGAVTVASTGTVIGLDSTGMAVENSNGTDTTVTVVDVSGGTRGIQASSIGATGALTITAAGTATGTAFDGIFVRNSSTGTDLTVSAADVTGGTNGINTLNEGTGPTLITTSSVVSGGTGNAISAASTGTSISVNNSGTLESGTGFALAANGGETTLANSGTVNGGVQLSGLNDSLANSGLFNATIDSDFGAGDDAFTNDGNVSATGATTLTGLEQFTNNGLVSLANGTVGDSLTLPGTYTGTGMLEVDVNSDGAGSADRLVIAGAATGNTSLIVNEVGTSPDFGNTFLIVDAGAGTTEDAFLLADEDATIGFLSYATLFDAGTGDVFLTSTIGTPVFQTVKYAEGAQSLWYRSADAWAAHIASLDEDTRTAPFWIQLHGNVATQDDSVAFSPGGTAQTVSLDYEQTLAGFQLGYDFDPGIASHDILFGVTGGYLSSDLDFDGTADSVNYGAFNIGSYAMFEAGRYFANALVKYDVIDADVQSQSAGYNVNLDGSAYGVRLEAGARFEEGDFFIQPLASLEYQQTSLDDFSALGADVRFDDFGGVRTMAGARIGGQTEVDGRNTVNYYADAKAVYHSETNDGVAFSTGTSSAVVDNRLSNTFGRLELGAELLTGNGFQGFIEGNADFSSRYSNFGARAGLRMKFK